MRIKSLIQGWQHTKTNVWVCSQNSCKKLCTHTKTQVKTYIVLPVSWFAWIFFSCYMYERVVIRKINVIKCMMWTEKNWNKCPMLPCKVLKFETRWDKISSILRHIWANFLNIRISSKGLFSVFDHNSRHSQSKMVWQPACFCNLQHHNYTRDCQK